MQSFTVKGRIYLFISIQSIDLQQFEQNLLSLALKHLLISSSLGAKITVFLAMLGSACVTQTPISDNITS